MAKPKQSPQVIKVTYPRDGEGCPEWRINDTSAKGVRYASPSRGILPKWSAHVSTKGTGSHLWTIREQGWNSFGDMMQEIQRSIHELGSNVANVTLKEGNKIVAKGKVGTQSKWNSEVTEWELHPDVIIVV